MELHRGTSYSLMELQRLRSLRDSAASLREAAELCVVIEEALGGRPPTRGFDQQHSGKEMP